MLERLLKQSRVDLQKVAIVLRNTNYEGVLYTSN